MFWFEGFFLLQLKMAGSRAMVFLVCFCLVSVLVLNTEGRYLPTRSDRDRLDKLRELLRDVSEECVYVMQKNK